jgi:hypothetical protein
VSLGGGNAKDSRWLKFYTKIIKYHITSPLPHRKTRNDNQLFSYTIVFFANEGDLPILPSHPSRIVMRKIIQLAGSKTLPDDQM